MVISSKGEYALRVMADLAINHDGRFIPLKEIVQKEELSQKYLESIMRMLSKANLIEAASGHGGGYRLKKALRNIHCGRYLNSRKVDLLRWHA